MRIAYASELPIGVGPGFVLRVYAPSGMRART